MNRAVERRLLQIVVAISCLSPLGFGMIGMVRGAAGFGGGIGGADSHFRYLSGIFFGVGLMALSTVPRIERMTERFSWVVLFVVIGGIARLAGYFAVGPPADAQFYAVYMELLVTPLLGLWQRRVARRYAGGGAD